MKRRWPPARISYAPERGELTGLVRLPATAWDQPETWWLDCWVTYETDRPEGLVLPVVLPEPGVAVFQEAARLLGDLCVVEAVVCHVRPPMGRATVMAIQETNAAADARRIRCARAMVILRAAMDAVHEEQRRRRSIGLTAPARKPVHGRQLELALA